MNTKKLLKTTGLCILMMLLTTLYSNAQIQFQGLHVDHEGTASWDADGTGPEPACIGHEHPFGWANTPYYGASRDYDDIDPYSDAALAHFLDDISGFPLFEQALMDNGFAPGQVKIKTGLMSLKGDVEGKDWFTLNNQHHFNYYNAPFIIELDGEPMISGYINYGFFSYDQSVYNSWKVESNYTKPYDASENSSIPIQDVAEAFLADMESKELRFIYEDMQSTGIYFEENGRDGVFFEIVSGYLEKGLPELPFTGHAADHEGLAIWNADGTGPEPEAYGHVFTWGGFTYQACYYLASCDYDDIDSTQNAALCHFINDAIGFPNLKVQLDYRNFTMDQLKVKSTIATHGNDIEGEDWGMDGSIYWYNYYGNKGIFEIAGEPILEYIIDTNYSFRDLNTNDNWESYMSNCKVVDISANASSDAQAVAASFLRDLGGHTIGSIMEGNYVEDMPDDNGRVNVVLQNIESGKVIARQPAGTHIWENEVSGTWDLAHSPYTVMGALEIPDGETLTIEPGVVIQFNTIEMMTINGCLVAKGTETYPILFTALDEPVSWGGIGWPSTLPTNDSSILKYCIFENSYAYNPDNLYGYNCGGAIRINECNKIEISHCTFRNNAADNFSSNNPAGGAISISESSFHISLCIFHDNTAPWGGAIAILTNSNPLIDNCLFYHNEAISQEGGAILSWTDSNPYIVNCTFADNHAFLGGGAAAIQIGGTTTITNCILWGNTGGSGPSQIDIWEPGSNPLNIYASDVEDGLDGITPGFQGEYLFNLNCDPVFTGVGEFQYVLDSTSCCHNVGTQNPIYLPQNYSIPYNCLCGNERILQSEIDMGCYESLGIETRIMEIGKAGDLTINIFPNPINSHPTIEFYLENDVPATISILDIHGRIISEIPVNKLQNGSNQVSWNAENIYSGIYFCQLKIGNQVITRKVVKIE